MKVMLRELCVAGWVWVSAFIWIVVVQREWTKMSEFKGWFIAQEFGLVSNCVIVSGAVSC